MKKTAVALQYPKNAPAPFIVAKGNGNLADAILAVAQENNVPVFCEPETVSILSLHQIGDCIPAQTYEVLAGIFAFLKKVEENEHN